MPIYDVGSALTFTPAVAPMYTYAPMYFYPGTYSGYWGSMSFSPGSPDVNLPSMSFTPGSPNISLVASLFSPGSSNINLPSMLFTPGSSNITLPTSIFTPGSSEITLSSVSFSPGSSGLFDFGSTYFSPGYSAMPVAYAAEIGPAVAFAQVPPTGITDNPRIALFLILVLELGALLSFAIVKIIAKYKGDGEAELKMVLEQAKAQCYH